VEETLQPDLKSVAQRQIAEVHFFRRLPSWDAEDFL
jgi:hypothetical protein